MGWIYIFLFSLEVVLMIEAIDDDAQVTTQLMNSTKNYIETPVITSDVETESVPSWSRNSGHSLQCLPNEINVREIENITATGTDLWCHTCSETYKVSFDPTDSPCFLNATQVAITRCGPLDRYCKVEKFRLVHQIVPVTIDRGCARTCPHGCRYNGFGQTYERCFDCCNTYGCNISNKSSRSFDVLTLHYFPTLSIVSMFNFLMSV